MFQANSGQTKLVYMEAVILSDGDNIVVTTLAKWNLAASCNLTHPPQCHVGVIMVS